MICLRNLGVATLFAVFAILSGAPVSPSNAVVDFKGKTLTIVIGYGVGGTYHQYAQLFSRHLGRHLADQPNVIVQTMPGGGGIRMLNEAANRMRADGTYLFVPPDTMVVTQLLETSGILFDARKFHYIGTADQQNTVWVVRKSKASSIQDLKTKEVFIGNSGKASTSLMIPTIATALLGLKVKLISGYEGSRDTIIAMERGEIDGAVYGWETWALAVPHWFEKGKETAVPILQVGVTPDPDAPAVPMMSSLVAKDDLPMVSLFETIGIIGRALVLPPGASPELVQTFREAFDQMLNDPEYRTEAGRLGLRVLPTSGNDLHKAISAAIDQTNEALILRARSILTAQ